MSSPKNLHWEAISSHGLIEGDLPATLSFREALDKVREAVKAHQNIQTAWAVSFYCANERKGKWTVII